MSGGAEGYVAPKPMRPRSAVVPSSTQRQLLDGDADLATLLVGEPEHSLPTRHRLLDGPLHGFRVGAVGQLDLDLTGVVGHADADVHGCS